MANDLILMAEPRTALGKQNKALRRTGRVPAVVYGPAINSTIQVSVDAREFERFYTRIGLEHPFTLQWEGGSARVVIREVQLEPTRHKLVHVDFFAAK